MIRAVFFDAAGTLLAPVEPVGETYARFARREGLEAVPAVLERCFRESFHAAPPLAFPGAEAADVPALEEGWWRAVLGGALGRAGLEPPARVVESVFRAAYDHFAKRKAWRLFADVRPAVAALRGRDIRLAVVSNFDSRLHGLLEAFGLAKFFDAVVISSESGFAKPDPRIFAAALLATGATPDATLHIGDSPELDVAGAERAGIRALRIDRASAASATSVQSLVEIRARLR